MNFDQWWNQEYNDSENPFAKDSFGYWAYAGWCGAMQVDTQERAQETVGWATITNGYPSMWVFNPEFVKNNPNTTATLYTAPPKREWVSLSPSDICEIFIKHQLEYVPEKVAQVIVDIEAKLKENNNECK